ncbi:MAG TPA: hypothetical protein ENJ53_05080 [Phaeodactylibacter sp.]|nr:hypothetical protein [Phaeodactylibacter sp.]
MRYKKYQNIRLNGRFFKSSDLRAMASVSTMPLWKKDIFDFILEWLDEQPTIIAHTSGTTGTPKKIFLEKNKMIASALKTGAFFFKKELNDGVKENNFPKNKNVKALLSLSPKYIAGKMMIVRAFVLGWDLTLVEPSGHPLQAIDFGEMDFAAMVPLQVLNTLQNKKERHLFSKIKKTIIGGGVVTDTLYRLLQNLPAAPNGVKNDCYATYGMTETITHIAVKKLNGNDASDYYQTLENVSITKDLRGCLVIDAPDVASQKIVTNDLVKIISPRQFQWLGRYDNVINSGGIKIIPEEVERLLQPFFTQRFFVSSQPDEVLGSRLILVIEGKSFSKKEKLNAFIKNNLPKYFIPKAIFFVEKFEETDSGKIKRKFKS